jgi:hypothetical protein
LTVDRPTGAGGRFDSAELSPEDNIGRCLHSSATVPRQRRISSVLPTKETTVTEERSP